ncbi:hypothetical protein GO755_12945 [Spirosoma sp. HMF4905]|uniref:Uncharacterized protein n=1 Tax=Spirosoma arboris TaxID=2682092 RepID=A0A7K1SAT4_9BACT|nr:hypothetical protein [Spirosoma arboris]MVM30942.1 hypothetical protein [Spirosoma arboris]
MRKLSFFLSVFLLGIVFHGFSQTTASTATTPTTATSSTDFYAGKWEIVIAGTPNGDSKMVADLIRKDGKLTGQLTNTADPSAEKIPLTSVVEGGDKLALGFNAQGYDLTIDLTKVDNDNLKGSMMNFDTTAKRVK